MIYTAGRVWIELLRIDAAEQITFFGITTRLNVWTSPCVPGALVVFLIITFVKRGTVQDSVFLAGREPASRQWAPRTSRNSASAAGRIPPRSARHG